MKEIVDPLPNDQMDQEVQVTHLGQVPQETTLLITMVGKERVLYD